MAPKPRYKDWKPGECRAKVELITEKGNRHEWLLPHRSPDDGMAIAVLCNQIATTEPGDEASCQGTQAILKVKAKVERELSGDKVWTLPPDDIQVVHVQQAIGIPVKGWEKNCYGIACAIIDAGLVDGHAVYGLWLGEVSEDNTVWEPRSCYRHGWIQLEDGRIMDPTRWSFEGVEPYIWLGENDGVYDEGANRFNQMLRRPCEQRQGFDKLHHLLIQPSVANDIWLLSERHIARDDMGLIVDAPQGFWIANLPYEFLEPHAREVYLAVSRAFGKAAVPIDNWQRAMR